MPVEIGVKIDDRGINDLLAGIQRRTNDLRPAISIIGEIIQASIQRNFEVSGRPRKWKKLMLPTCVGIPSLLYLLSFCAALDIPVMISPNSPLIFSALLILYSSTLF